MLRISKITDYGTLVMTQMASDPARRFSATDLAAALGLGGATVSKVLKLLGQQGLVRSTRGLRGGYTLARAPGLITLADIVAALEERPFGLTECSATAGLCTIEAGCNVRASWQRINGVIRHALEQVTLADMVAPSVADRAAGTRPIAFAASPASQAPASLRLPSST